MAESPKVISVIGAVRCCDLSNVVSAANWRCSWSQIGFQWSHWASEDHYRMCSAGSYMTAINFDAVEDNDGNSPIIGSVSVAVLEEVRA